MEGKDHNILRQDEGLRRAVARRERRLPEMSAGLNERLMERMEKNVSVSEPASSSVLRHRWIWGVAAGIAVMVVVAVAGLLSPSSSSLSQDVRETETDTVPRVHEVVGATSGLLASADVEAKTVGKVARPRKPRKAMKAVTHEEVVRAEDTVDSVELTSDQRKMERYVAQLAEKYKAQRMSLDCDKEGKGVIYMFQDDKNTDVFARLCMVAVWLNTDKPGVRMSYSSNQMTLELDGDEKGKRTNEVWLADRRDGRIYLYHSQSAEDEWASAGCYMNFLAMNTPPHFAIDMRK